MPDTNRPLDGQVAIVTGAGAHGDHVSIGSMEAVRLAQLGARVIVNNRGGDTNPSSAENVAQRIRDAGGEAFANNDSVDSFDSGRRMVEAALDHFGRIDILLNNAGVVQYDLIWEMPESDFDAMIAINLKGTFNTVRNVAPHFKKQNSGVIINTASNSGLGQYGNAAYAAAKEGVVGFTRSIARDFGPHNIRCNTIRPLADSKIAFDDKIARLLFEAEQQYGFPLLGDIWFTKMPAVDLNPLHVANLAAWLCMDMAKDINGLDFEIHGERIGLLTAPTAERSIILRGGWSLEALGDLGVWNALVDGRKNMFQTKLGTGEQIDRDSST